MDRESDAAHSRRLRRSLLGEGEYYYHAISFDRLESAKKLGLTTPSTHRMPSGYSITSGVQNRLFLFPHELDGIEYLDRPDKSVLLRFKRTVAEESPPYHDPNYPTNESTAFHHVNEVYSLSIDATVSPANLQACTHAKREPGHKRWSTCWVPVEQVRDLIHQGWEYVDQLPTREAVVKLPF